MQYFKTANGHNIAFELAGQGMPLVLISGFTADHQVWNLVRPMLEKHFRVLSFDNRGIGVSDTPSGPYSIYDMATDTYELIKHCFPKARVNIVGHSMGGAIVQMLAKQYAAVVNACVIAHSFCKLATPFRLVCELKLKMYEAGIDREFIDFCALPWAFGLRLLENRELVDAIVQDMKNTPHPQSYEGYKNQWHALACFDSTNWASSIKAPCLLIAGSEDLISPVNDSRQLKEKMEQAEIVTLDGVGHVGQAEAPERFAAVVKEFFSKVSQKET